MTLQPLLSDVPRSEHTLAVISDGTNPLEAMLSEAFDDQQVAVDARPELAREFDEGAVVLLDGAGEYVATSTLTELYDAVLAINSDLFVTGARGLGEIELPAVLANLDDARFRLRGYPLAHKEKLLLILASRLVEQRAWRAGAGTFRAAFQRLSRIDDEAGTRRVYERLVATDLDVHLYGVSDGVVPDIEATVHAGEGETYPDSWFVVFRPARPAESGAAAILALETEPRTWTGCFTFDPERVAAIDRTVRNED